MRRTYSALLGILLLFCVPAVTADENDPDVLLSEGKEALRLSETDSHAVVTAASKFAGAALLYEARNDSEKAVQANSFLYWCKKKMTLKEIDDFVAAQNDAGKKLSQVDQPVPKDEAQTFYDGAEKFETANPKEYLAIAVRYFEVADRFAGTEMSLKAQKKSLEAQQKALKSAAEKQKSINPAEGKHPAIDAADKARTQYDDAAAKARDRFLKSLKHALDVETQKGNLDNALVFKNEMGRLSEHATVSTVELKDPEAAYSQRIFATEILAAKKVFIAAMVRASKEETEKKNLDKALKIKDEIRAFTGAPEDAIEFQNHYYKSFAGDFTWSDAKRICEDKGGNLVCIETKEEEDFLEATFFTGERAGNGSYWIGMHQDEQRHWVWVNGAAISYRKFHTGEPNGSGPTISIRRNKKQWGETVAWDDTTQTQWLICEWGY